MNKEMCLLPLLKQVRCIVYSKTKVRPELENVQGLHFQKQWLCRQHSLARSCYDIELQSRLHYLKLQPEYQEYLHTPMLAAFQLQSCDCCLLPLQQLLECLGCNI